MLADMPSVRPALIDRLIDAFLARPDVAVAAPVVSGQRGNPVILSRRLFAAASALEGDEGARRIIAGIDAARVALVEDADGGSALDIDTRAALAAAREL
jgi:molybdenum cofactor cytidylyltransferase